jgi:hypothetical protein
VSDQISMFAPPAPRPGETCPCCGQRVPLEAAPALLESLDGRPRSHRDGPQTERLAAAMTWPRAGTGRRRVIEALAAAGDTGRTFDELIVELAMYSAQKRLHDVKRAGWAVGTGRTRDTRTGAPAEVYVLSEAAAVRLAVAA